MKSYDEMSFEELELVNRELMTKKKEIQDEQRKVNEHMNKKAVGQRAQQKFEAMSEEEKAELAKILKVPQTISASGIDSQEKVGTPGKGFFKKLFGG